MGVPRPGQKLRSQPAARRCAGGHCRAICRQLRWDQRDQIAAILGILSLALLVYCTFFRPVEQMLADASTSIFCLFYVGMTLVTLPALREETNGPSLVAFLLCVVWAGDMAALYVGRAWGRHKMAPSLSPNKTWEGALGSLAGSLLAAGALARPGASLCHPVG
jgi:phosphatidate cytidylyltransferase